MKTVAPMNLNAPRICLRDPIAEITDAARYLDAAVSAHLSGNAILAETLIRMADMDAIREWTESIWAHDGAFVTHRDASPQSVGVSDEKRAKARMPTVTEKMSIHLRDG